jgi:hypothetical protein
MVLICGHGVAASCCAHLLSRAGFPVLLDESRQTSLPAVMLSPTTQKLLEDVFESSDLFFGLPRIHRRVVLWGDRTEPLTLPHSALVISERALLNRIDKRCAHSDCLSSSLPDWTIHASHALPPGVSEHPFGLRTATASSVKLKITGDAESCWIESLAAGWLFLLPDGAEDGWLMSVGESAEVLLAESRLVAGHISAIGANSGTFSCHPRIVNPLCGARWLSCGTAAVRFDPLCGDGAGHAVRQAILGAAVIRAVAQGADSNALSIHYRSRIMAGFRKHLEVCHHFYQTGGNTPWWHQQLIQIDNGLRWSAGQLAAVSSLRFRLNGFSLEGIARPKRGGMTDLTNHAQPLE